jgi:hypothetical protein
MVKKEDGSFHKLICVIFIHPAMLDCFGVIKSLEVIVVCNRYLKDVQDSLVMPSVDVVDVFCMLSCRKKDI